MIGRVVEVTAGLEALAVHHSGVLVAARSRRWVRGWAITDPAHMVFAAKFRTRFQAHCSR
jgi:hypothetical protein